MGDALIDLEQVLRPRMEQLSLDEARMLREWRMNAMEGFIVGFADGSIVTWLATGRLSSLFRLNLTLGAAAACGLWRYSRSIESSIESMLSLERSQMQRELATILSKKYHDIPWVRQRLSKNFYPEEVYNDSSVDKPILRWRYRTFSGEHASLSQSTSYREETDSQNNAVKAATTTTQRKTEPKKGNANVVDDAMESPFDLIFGLKESLETRPDPGLPDLLSRRKVRRDKRAHRRRRRHHHEESEI